MTFFSRLKAPSSSGWAVFAADASHLRYVRGDAHHAGKPRLLAFGEASLSSQNQQDLSRAAKQFRLSRMEQQAVLLDERDYRIHLLEAPDVPVDELKAAMKWRLKEIIDFPVEEASYDILHLLADGRGTGLVRSVYAIAAKKEVVKTYVDRFDRAGLRLRVIDIPETAQRNIATLYEEENRAVALLYLDGTDGLLTVSAGGELYLARRFDISLNQLLKTQGAAREDIFNRLVLALQRTLDNFERQFSFVAVGKLLIGPVPEETGLLEHLVANLGVRTETIDLRDVIAVPEGSELDLATQWRMFHLIGCSFRQEGPVQ